eukprot:TRINITY_DN6163_c0_g1_i1.p1 TRINITY_DN6163_c0_g1~~TRINITY_DN6163_c0_g1_i1.p1  ORF type:complete len:202 (+),score=42.75 TRINITY_DN6163_c0_g1_i1:21-626(+)
MKNLFVILLIVLIVLIKKVKVENSYPCTSSDVVFCEKKVDYCCPFNTTCCYDICCEYNFECYYHLGKLSCIEPVPAWKYFVSFLCASVLLICCCCAIYICIRRRQRGNQFEYTPILYSGTSSTQGISEEILSTFPIKTFQEMSEDSKEALCVVCLDNYEPTTLLRILPCSHSFHVACIDKWLKKCKTCPTCRHQLDQSINS